MFKKLIHRLSTSPLSLKSLRIKLLLFVNGFILLVITLIAMILIQFEKQNLMEKVAIESRNMARILSIPISNAMQSSLGSGKKNPGIILRYIDDIRNLTEGLDIEYIYVTEADHQVFAATRPCKAGMLYRGITSYPADNLDQIQSLISSDETNDALMEVYAPLQSGTGLLGFLYIGINLDNVETQITEIVKNIILITISIFFFTFLIVSGYIDLHIRPITLMSGLMNKVSDGDLSPRIEWKSRDEIGILSETFNKMMDKLEGARKQEQQTMEKLCQTEKIAAIGLLASGVAHEINNPLSGILTCLDTLSENSHDTRTIEKYITLIQDGVVRIERIVKQLLEFSKQRPFMPSWTHVETLMDETAALLNYQLRTNGVEVHQDYDRKKRQIFVDAHQIKQVIMNLMMNAIQAMPDGGNLFLKTRYNEKYITFSIMDTGVGIREEHKRLIFNPFFTTREVGKGTGLGLSVTLGIIESHYGTIDVESSSGGSKFTIKLPINRIELEQASTEEKAE